MLLAQLLALLLAQLLAQAIHFVVDENPADIIKFKFTELNKRK
jgi:hypothetical protein